MNEIELKNHKERIKKNQEYQDKLNEILEKHKQIKNEYKKTNNVKYIKKKRNYQKELERKQDLEKIKEKYKESMNDFYGKNSIKDTKLLKLSFTMKRIINLLKIDDMIRRDLVDILGLARTTIYDNLVKLERIGIVSKYTVNQGIRSRPLTFWTLDKEKLKELELIE